jgi:hypothetical protein
MTRAGTVLRVSRKGSLAAVSGLMLVAGSTSAWATPLGLNLEVGYNRHSNVTRAPQGSPDVLSDQFLGLNLNKNFAFPLTQHTRFVVNGFAGGEKFLDFDGLSRVLYGVQGTWQYRPSAEYSAPTYGVFLRISGDQYRSDLRDGYRASAGVSIRKPVTDRIEILGVAAYNARNARDAVFDTRDWSARFNVDYSLFGRDTLYFGGEYRRGDTVSTTQASSALSSIAKAIATDDAFDDGIARWAYRFQATTLIGAVGYNFAFASGQSLDLAYRYVRSTPTDTAPYPYGNENPRYVDHQIGLSYLLRF